LAKLQITNYVILNYNKLQITFMQLFNITAPVPNRIMLLGKSSFLLVTSIAQVTTWAEGQWHQQRHVQSRSKDTFISACLPV